MTTDSAKLATLAIGAAGELLVQYKLLKLGIDSARLTTDSGIDLVMYVPGTTTAATIQVKTKAASDRAGGKGKLLLGFRFPDACPAQWLALVDLSRDAVWLLTIDQARDMAQQTHPNNNRLLYWYTDESIGADKLRDSDMISHRLEAVAAQRLQAGL